MSTKAVSEETLEKRISQFTIKDLLMIFISVLIALGGLVTAWVNLNNNIVRMETQFELNGEYVKERLVSLKSVDIEINKTMELILREQKKSNEQLQEQVNDLERIVSRLYQSIIHK